MKMYSLCQLWHFLVRLSRARPPSSVKTCQRTSHRVDKDGGGPHLDDGGATLQMSLVHLVHTREYRMEQNCLHLFWRWKDNITILLSPLCTLPEPRDVGIPPFFCHVTLSVSTHTWDDRHISPNEMLPPSLQPPPQADAHFMSPHNSNKLTSALFFLPNQRSTVPPLLWNVWAPAASTRSLNEWRLKRRRQVVEQLLRYSSKRACLV